MKTNQFRAMMLVLLMAVISLGRMNAQVITVSGTVTDAKDGNPLVGCSVQIKGTSKGAITNMKGQYTIQAKKGETLLFQYIGYKQERRVVKSATLDVKMKADDVVLEECVVVGYGHELKATKSVSAAYMAVCPTPGIMYDAVNAEEYVLWTEGILSLNNDPLNVILAKLGRYYGVDINCTDDISTIKITGKIDLECGVEAALKRISATGGFSFLKRGDTYMLKPLEKIVQ